MCFVYSGPHPAEGKDSVQAAVMALHELVRSDSGCELSPLLCSV